MSLFLMQNAPYCVGGVNWPRELERISRPILATIPMTIPTKYLGGRMKTESQLNRQSASGAA